MMQGDSRVQHGQGRAVGDVSRVRLQEKESHSKCVGRGVTWGKECFRKKDLALCTDCIGRARGSRREKEAKTTWPCHGDSRATERKRRRKR